MQKKQKLYQRVTKSFLVVILSASILVGLYAYWSFESSILRLQRETSDVIADSYVQKLKTISDKAVYPARLVAGSIVNPLNLANRDDQFKNANRYLEQLMHISSNISETYMAFEEDLNLSDESTKTIQISETDYIYWVKDPEGNFEKKKDENFKITQKEMDKLRRDRQVLISEPFLTGSPEKNNVSIAVMVPVEAGNKFYGAIGINYVLSEAEFLINRPLADFDGARLVLLSKDRNILFFSGKEWLNTKNFDDYYGIERRMYDKIRLGKPIVDDGTTVAIKKNIYTVPGNSWEFMMVFPHDTFASGILNNFAKIIIFSVLMMFGASLVVVFILKRQFSALNQLQAYAEEIALGGSPNFDLKTKSDEISGTVRQLIIFANRVKSAQTRIAGLISDDLEPIEEESQDELNTLLDNLRVHLSDMHAKRSLDSSNLHIQNWLNKGHLDVEFAQQKNPHEIEKLSDNILKTMMDYAGASVAGLYFHYREDVKESYLQIISAYAYGDMKHPKKRFKLGEGLVGTCAVEKKNIQLDNITENYLTIQTGLNVLPPKFLFLLPIIYQGALIGVAEFVFLHRPEEHKLKFIDDSIQKVGGWMDTAINNARNRKLLEISQQQTTELSEKEAELSLQLIETQKLQAENIERATDMQSILQALDYTVMRVDYTLDGTVLYANELYLHTMGYGLDQVKGTNIFQFVGKDQKDQLIATIEEVKKGKSVERKITRKTAFDEMKDIFASYSPYFNQQGEVERVIFFGFDVSRIQK